MRPFRFVTAVACPLTALALSVAALAQNQPRPAQPKQPGKSNTFTVQPRAQTPARTLNVLTTPTVDPRAARMGQYPMPIARVDVSGFNMPIAGGDPSRYPIRVIRPAGEAVTLETPPPIGVPVDPKLLEPVRLQLAPARPPISK